MFFSLALLLVGACSITADPAAPAPRARAQTPAATFTRNDVDALLLFEDGQNRLRAGKYGTAAVAFQTLIAVYPESPLVPRAAEALRASEQLEESESHTRIVRSLRFEDLPGVSVQDVLRRFEERELELGLEKPCTTKMLEEARTVLTELLSENGHSSVRVELNTRDLPPKSIEVTFRIVKG